VNNKMSKTIFRTIAFQVDDADFLREYDQRQKESGLSVKNYFISLIKADIAMHQAQDSDPSQEGGENEEAFAPEQEETDAALSAEPDETAYEDLGAEQAQTGDAAQGEEMMNLFVKITRDQREALETHKLETGETVGNVLNRIIDKFLDCADSLPEGFDDAYKHYSANPKFCDTTCSAKIPVRVNQELTEYLNSFGGLRNALMASLVELELREQEMAETPDEDQSAGMTM
jgi:hypothetical protein